MSESEFTSLNEIGASILGGHNAALTWYLARIEMAIEKNQIKLSTGATTMIYDKITNLRGLKCMMVQCL